MADKVKPFKEGVYLALSEDEHHDVDALGSSDFKDLWSRKEGWWWKSRHNPNRRKTESSAQTFGKGLHCRLLEGSSAFADRYAIEPDKAAFSELVVTAEDIISALAGCDAPKPSTKARKADLIEMARVYLGHRDVWDLIIEKAALIAGNRTLLSAEEARDIELMTDLAMSEPDIAAVLGADAEVRLSEVSVFWRLPDGTMTRYRFDGIVPDGNIDLKTVGNARGDFKVSVAERLAYDHLAIQMAWSFEARKAAYRLITAGKIYGGTKEERTWTRRFPKWAPLDRQDYTIPAWAWLWIFYQRPDSSQGMAPTILPVRQVYGSKLHLDGIRKSLTALERYRTYREKFGLDRPWTSVLPVHDVNGGGANDLDVPPWGDAAMHVEGEEEAMTWRKGAI